MTSNLPPGCTSDDGGVDHALEAALERLCDKIPSYEVAKILQAIAPAAKDLVDQANREGWNLFREMAPTVGTATEAASDWRKLQILEGTLPDDIDEDLVRRIFVAGINFCISYTRSRAGQ